MPETDHSAKVIAYKPDEAGNVYEKTNRLNEVTRYSFDNGNRLTRVAYLKDGTFETFGYDAAGNRNAAANANVSYAFSWDRLNRLLSKTDSRGRSLSFTYDAVGNVLTKTTYQGSTTAYVYNAANRLVMLRNPDYTQVDYQYDPAGRLLSRVTANGVHTNYQYDAAGRMTRLTQYDAADALVSDTTYTRDRLGNILTATDTSGTTTYTYDPLYRLKTADYPGAANDELFTWDQVGNRKTYTKGSLTANGNTRYYAYQTGSNRVQNIRIGSPSGTLESAFTWDDEGRLTGQTGTGAKTLTWDAKGRLWSLTNGNGTEVYDYDPMDYRIGRSGGLLGNLDYFLEGEHLESVYQSGTLKEKYFRGASTDELVAAFLTDTDGKLKPFLFHHDQVNSVSAVSGHNGGIAQSLKYQAFGQTQAETGTSPSRLKYTGREDDGTGLYYFRARYLDPGIGFVSEDPIGFAGGINFHQYAGSNAVNFNDPMGMMGESLIPKAIQWIGTKLPKNWRLAGDVHPTTGIPFKETGFPDFSGVATASAKVQQTGVRAVDEAAANKAMGFSNTPNGYTWHHVEDGNTMQLVPTNIHAATGHSGGVAVVKATAGVGAAATAGNAEASDGGILGTGITWSDVGNFLVDFFTPGGVGEVGKGSDIVPSAQTSGYTSTQGSYGGSAGGGFLLYPNKTNTNMMQSVYSK